MTRTTSREIGLSVLTDTAADRQDRRVVRVERAVLARNDELAAANRKRFAQAGLPVIDLLSSPGSGKTTLLARTARELGAQAGVRVGVIVGDLATDNDARALRSSGAEAVQITTGGVCHLEAAMVARAAAALELDALDLLFIENVGNLVCPAAFDLGAELRVVLLAVTEGEDKPLKYPAIFKRADVVVITKTDLAAATGFDRAAALANLQQVTPAARVLELSARSGAGMDAWYALLQARLAEQGRTAAAGPSELG